MDKICIRFGYFISHLLFVVNSAFDTMQIFWWNASWLECKLSTYAVGFVHNFHRSILLDPHFADDNIMHTAINIRPRIRFIPLWQLNSDDALWLDLHTLTPKFELRMNGAVKFEMRWVGMECRYRWVVRHLLANYSKIRVLIFIRFAKYRIKWLAQSLPIRCQRWYGKAYQKQTSIRLNKFTNAMEPRITYRRCISFARQDPPVRQPNAIDAHTPCIRSYAAENSAAHWRRQAL